MELTQEQAQEYEKLKKQKQKQLDRQNRYNAEKYDRFNIVMDKGDHERVKAAAKTAGAESVSAYIKALIYADMERMGIAAHAPESQT